MFDSRKFARCSQQIIDAGRFLYGQGWSPATSSNYSARLDAEHIAITVSGKHKGKLGAEDIMVVDLQGQPVASPQKSSAETLLHTVIYDAMPEVGAVLHTHSPSATVLSRVKAGEGLLELEDYELQKAFEGVTTHEGKVQLPIIENSQDILALSKETLELFTQYPRAPGYLIRGHGLYTWASDMEACLRHIEAIEFLLHCELETMRLLK